MYTISYRSAQHTKEVVRIFNSPRQRGESSSEICHVFSTSGMRALMATRKLLLHEFCGLPIFLGANIQAPSSFRGMLFFSDLITFPMYLLVLLMM